MSRNTGLKSLLAALIIAFVHGMIYVFIVPPWQHYDEPVHFEYAWLLSEKNRALSNRDVEADKRKAIMKSMALNGFYPEEMTPAILASATDPNTPTPEIGYTQLNDSPVYYAIPSLSLKLTDGFSLESRLILARLTSLALLLITIAACWGTARQLSDADSRLPGLAASALALTPPFVDLMTALNNDVGVTAFGSLSLWCASAMHKAHAQGRKARHVILAISAIALAVIATSMKTTGAPLLLVVPLWTLFLLARSHRRFGILILLSPLLIAAAVIRHDDAQFWYRNDAARQPEGTSCISESCESPSGATAIRFSAATRPEAALYQPLPLDHTRALAGRAFQLRAWMWTDTAAAQARSPTLWADNLQSYAQDVSLSTTPQRVIVTGMLRPDIGRLRVVLNAPTQPTTATIFFSDIELIRSDDSSGQNWLRNGSGAATWPRLGIQAVDVLQSLTPEWISWSAIVSSIQDMHGIGWYFWDAAERIFRTYWGQFAWGHVGAQPIAFWIAGLLTVIGAIGWLAKVALEPNVDSRLWCALAVTILLVSVLALVRGVTNTLEGPGPPYLPVARYLYPVAAPLTIALATGWLKLFERLGHQEVTVNLVLGGYAALTAIGVTTVSTFYS